MTGNTARLAACALLAAACGEQAPQSAAGEASPPPGCEVVRSEIALPATLSETSGLALGRRDEALLWTHNDSGHGPVLYALGTDGQVRGQVRVRGAENEDWEDLAAGPCPAGDCLYVGDIGDNDAEREEVTIYRVPEPEAGQAETAPAEAFRARYPEGPRDAEALFVLDDGSIHLVTKGRDAPIALYRYPGEPRAGEVVVLERVRELGGLDFLRGQLVTGAAAAPGGGRIAIRSYGTIGFFTPEALLGGGEPTLTANLSPLMQPQGEGVALGRERAVALSTEGESNAPASLSLLRCPAEPQ